LVRNSKVLVNLVFLQLPY